MSLAIKKEKKKMAKKKYARFTKKSLQRAVRAATKQPPRRVTRRKGARARRTTLGTKIRSANRTGLTRGTKHLGRVPRTRADRALAESLTKNVGTTVLVTAGTKYKPGSPYPMLAHARLDYEYAAEDLVCLPHSTHGSYQPLQKGVSYALRGSSPWDPWYALSVEKSDKYATYAGLYSQERCVGSHLRVRVKVTEDTKALLTHSVMVLLVIYPITDAIAEANGLVISNLSAGDTPTLIKRKLKTFPQKGRRPIYHWKMMKATPDSRDGVVPPVSFDVTMTSKELYGDPTLQLSAASGGGSAVWHVVNALSPVAERFHYEVYMSYETDDYGTAGTFPAAFDVDYALSYFTDFDRRPTGMSLT